MDAATSLMNEEITGIQFFILIEKMLFIREERQGFSFLRITKKKKKQYI